MLNKTVTVELRSIADSLLFVRAKPGFALWAVFRDAKNETFEKQINHLLCWWLKLLQLTVL